MLDRIIELDTILKVESQRWFSPVASGVRGQDFSKGLLPTNDGWQWISDGKSSHYTLVQVSI